jgi:hypothetical protein
MIYLREVQANPFQLMSKRLIRWERVDATSFKAWAASQHELMQMDAMLAELGIVQVKLVSDRYGRCATYRHGAI